MVADLNDPRNIAFDSNVLTYFLDGNRGDYSMRAGDPLAEQRIAAVRLYMYAQPYIVPTVRAEAARILDVPKLDEHRRFIDFNFGEIWLHDWQQKRTDQRATELQAYHGDADDCRIVAEIEEHGHIWVLVTCDLRLQERLSPHARIRIETPTQCWSSFAIASGTMPPRSPAPGHPLATETWWRW